MLTNSNLFALLPTPSPDWGFDEDSVNLVAMPLFHIGGSGYATVGMFVGCHTILLREVDPAAMLAADPREAASPTCSPCPAVLQFMLMVPGVDDIDFSTLRIDRLRRVADLGRGARRVDRDVRRATSSRPTG